MWLKLDRENSHLARDACAAGFDFHHAKKDYVMLNKWINPDLENKLPGFASHYVGVGGMVVNKAKDKILCI